MKVISGPYFRPVMRLSKEEIEQYLTLRGLEWREDSSNQSREYKRNQVRLDLLPLMAELTGGKAALSARFAQIAQQSEDLQEWIESEVKHRSFVYVPSEVNSRFMAHCFSHHNHPLISPLRLFTVRYIQRNDRLPRHLGPRQRVHRKDGLSAPHQRPEHAETSAGRAGPPVGAALQRRGAHGRAHAGADRARALEAAAQTHARGDDLQGVRRGAREARAAAAPPGRAGTPPTPDVTSAVEYCCACCSYARHVGHFSSSGAWGQTKVIPLRKQYVTNSSKN